MKKFRGTKSEISAFIGVGTEIKGELQFDGVLRLDGKFTGEISSGGTLVIGDTAHVTAEIDVDTVQVRGEVHGNIRANNRVELHSPAKHYGNIISPVVTIAEGVVFEGNCHMKDPAEYDSQRQEESGKKVTLISKEGQGRLEAEIL